MARTFNGSSDFAQVALNLSSVNKLTIAFWLWQNVFDDADELAMEFTANANSNVGGFYIDPNASTSSLHKFGIAWNGGSGVITLFTRPSAAAWHQYVILIDGSLSINNVPAVYVDGVSQSVVIPGAGGAASFANSTMNIMCRNGASLFNAGRMADLAFYGGYLLTAGEALALGTGAARPWQVGRSASIFECYPLYGLASPEPDFSGNRNNLTLTGTSKSVSDPPITMTTPRWPQWLIPPPPPAFTLWAQSAM